MPKHHFSFQRNFATQMNISHTMHYEFSLHKYIGNICLLQDQFYNLLYATTIFSRSLQMSCCPLSHNESLKEVGEYGLRRKEYTV